MTSTGADRSTRGRLLVLLLAALAALAALLLPATPASAASSPAAEKGVGAIHSGSILIVGVHESIRAGQHPVRGPSQLQLVSGHCVAAEAEGAESAVPRVVNLGGEGEVPGAINQQIPAALRPGWGASRTDVAGKSLAELRQMGDAYVVSENTALPFANDTIDRVITNSVPIDVDTILGPGVQSSEIWRILKPGGEWLHNGEVMPWP